MTREELKAHCERQIQQFERVKKIMPVTPNDWQRYEEHKMVLELLEQESVLNKARTEIENTMKYQYAIGEAQYAEGFEKSLEIIDKCMPKDFGLLEVDEMEGCHSCKYGEKFDTEKEPCKHCYGLSMYTRKREQEFHCGVEESGGHAYNCNDCPNKCDEWYRWDKEMKK